MTLVLPVSPGRYVTVEGQFPLSLEEWEQLLSILQAMRPGLMRTGPGKGWNQ